MRKFGIIGAAIAVGAGVLAALAVAAGSSGGTTAHDSTGTITDSGPRSQGSLCPSDQEARGLGLSTRGVPAGNDNLTVTALGRYGDNSAKASVIAFKTPALLAAIAYCSESGPSIKVRKVTKPISYSGLKDKPGVVSASCKKGEKLLFGGFQLPSSNEYFTLAGAFRSGTTWKTQAYNFNESDPDNVTSTAYCAKGESKLTTVKTKVAVAPGQIKSAKATCKRGSRVIFGGFKGDVTGGDAYVLLRTSKRTDNRTWKITARNENEGSPGSLKAYAYCRDN